MNVTAAFIIILLVSWPGEAAAQSDELMSAHQQCRALNNQGRFGDAESFCLKALKLGETELGSENVTVAALLNNLANLYYNQSRYDDAEPLFKRSLAINEKTYGSEHRKMALNLNNLAVLHSKQGHYGEAELLHKRSLAIREKIFGPNHHEVVLENRTGC